jgi:hypothetical protein
MEHEGKTRRTDRRKLLLDAIKLIGISGRDRFPNYQGIFQLQPDYRSNSIQFIYLQT